MPVQNQVSTILATALPGFLVDTPWHITHKRCPADHSGTDDRVTTGARCGIKLARLARALKRMRLAALWHTRVGNNNGLHHRAHAR
ncbi:MAG: hypothetical protein U1E82_01675 [Nitrosomonas sp.]